MITSENKRRKWFEWGMVASFIALLSFLFTYLINWGGSMEATYQTRSINNGESKKIVVCLEDASININGLSITPTFKNNSRVSLKHFSLSFETECFGVTLEPSTFVEAYNYNESKCLFSYKDKELAAHDESKPPFSGIIINSSLGWCKIKSKASFDGKSDAFECYTYVYFFVVPNKEGLNYTDWKKKCEKCYMESIKGYSFDLYYYSKNRQAEYLDDISVGDAVVNPIDEQTIEEKAPKNNDTPPEETKSNDMLVDRVEGCFDNIQCEISRTDSTLTYNLTMNFYDTISKLYLLEGRIKPKRNQFYYDHNYNIVYIGKNQKTKEVINRFRKGRPPVIDKVSLYPQCNTDEVISIEKKMFSYIIRNKSAYAVVCFIKRPNYTTYIELDGDGKTRLRNLGVSPIEVFMTDRKFANERHSLYMIWVLLFVMLLGFASLAAVFILIANVFIFVKELLDTSFNFRKAFEETLYYEILHDDITQIRYENTGRIKIVGSILLVLCSLVSPYILFLCIKFFFL